MDTQTILKKFENVGVGQVAALLIGLPGHLLHTLLMHVFAGRSSTSSAAEVSAQYRESRFVRPCPIGQRTLIEADAIAYRILDPRFLGIETSPVVPLGSNAVLGGVNQKTVLGTIRSNEVVADSTTALTLECAQQRALLLEENPKSAEIVRLATSVRCLRLQRFDNVPGFVPHFKAFALATAGRDTGNEEFEIRSVQEHLTFYLAYLSAMQSAGYQMHDVRVEIADVRIMRAIVAHHKLDPIKIGRQVRTSGFSVFQHYRIALPGLVQNIDEPFTQSLEDHGVDHMHTLIQKLWAQVIGKLRDTYPSITFAINLDRAAGMNYYQNGCFKISAENSADVRYPIVDGGFTDWTQQLVSSKKERLLVSGIGTELLCSNFHT